MTKTEKIERLKEMYRLYDEEKLNLVEVGKQFGISKQAVHEQLVKAGYQLRPRKRRKILIEKQILKELHLKEKLSIADIAERLQKSYGKVASELKRHGIPNQNWGYLKKKYSNIENLKINEKMIIQNERWKQPFSNLYEFAKRAGIRISIKTLNKQEFEITRVV